MRAFLLCLSLVLISGCDSTDEPAALDRTALQIRVNDPGVERVTQRFTRSDTDVTVGVFPDSCGGATRLTFVGRNASGESLRLEATVDTDGALEVPFTIDVPSADLDGTVVYSGPLPGTREAADDLRFTVARGVLSLIESTPSRAQGAIQVSGGGSGLDMDATGAFDVAPEALACGDD